MITKSLAISRSKSHNHCPLRQCYYSTSSRMTWVSQTRQQRRNWRCPKRRTTCLPSPWCRNLLCNSRSKQRHWRCFDQKLQTFWANSKLMNEVLPSELNKDQYSFVKYDARGRRVTVQPILILWRFTKVHPVSACNLHPVHWRPTWRFEVTRQCQFFQCGFPRNINHTFGVLNKITNSCTVVLQRFGLSSIKILASEFGRVCL